MIRVRTLVIIVLALGLTGAAATAAVSPFAYRATAPLGFVDRGRVNDEYPIAVRDVSFFSQGRRVDGYLAVPPRKGPLPAAIVLHGQGGDRTSMLVQATWLAARGVVVMTLTAPSTTATRPAGMTASKTLAFERDLAVRDVVAVRRAVDALARHRLVDERRIGFVGWSLGARSGAVIAGVEPRIDGLALLSGGATPVATYAAAAPVSLRPAIRRALGDIDPLRWVARSRPGSVLLLAGRKDEVVPRPALLALQRSAPPGTDVRWYQADHALNARASGPISCRGPRHEARAPTTLGDRGAGLDRPDRLGPSSPVSGLGDGRAGGRRCQGAARGDLRRALRRRGSRRLLWRAGFGPRRGEAQRSRSSVSTAPSVT